MIERHQKRVILSRLQHFPAVAVFGPRQAGKTTLAKAISPAYYDLEAEEEKLRLDLQWQDILSSKNPVILDEARNDPEVFPRLRSAIDQERKRNGRFLILGSVSPVLMKEVSQSLTGRLAVCELAPLSLEELTHVSENELWLMGGFPDGGILKKRNFSLWQRNYLDLMAMRDLPLWGLPSPPRTTKRLFRMLAASHGNTWNASQIGKSLGITYHTVNAYLDYLEQAFLIRRLPPFHANIRKRLVKSPKVYWRDTGLLHTLMGVRSFKELIAQPWVGTSWEGWIIEQILTSLSNHDVEHEPFFFRTSDGYELDLVLILSGETVAIEIKLTTSPVKEDLDRLVRVGQMIGADRTVLISRTEKPIEAREVASTNLKGLLSMLI
jgi:predicted AAA+ superfamily ATPase